MGAQAPWCQPWLKFGSRLRPWFESWSFSMMQFQQFIILLVLMDGTGAGNAELFNNTRVSKQWPIASFDEGSAGNTSGHSADLLDLLEVSGNLIEKINEWIASNLDKINAGLVSLLQKKDPMTINLKKGPVKFEQLENIKTCHIGALEVKKAIKGNVITFGMSLECVDLKIVGTAFKKVSIAGKVQQPRFLFDPIVAHLDSSTGTIQNFDVKVSVNMGPTEVEIAGVTRYLPPGDKSKTFKKAVNKILQKKKNKMEKKLAQEIQDTMAKALDEKLKPFLNQWIEGRC